MLNFPHFLLLNCLYSRIDSTAVCGTGKEKLNLSSLYTTIGFVHTSIWKLMWVRADFFLSKWNAFFFKCLNMSMFASTRRCYFEPSNKTISTNIFRILTPIENTQISICSDEFAILREKANFLPYFRITHHILSMCMKPFSASFGMLKIIFKCKVDKLFDGRLIVNMCYG